MWIALSDPRARFPFVSIVTLIFAALSYSAAKSCLAAAWNSSSNPARWESAARLEPGNAAHQEKLGLYREWDLDHRDLAAAEQFLRRAVSLNPHSAKYWLELASIEEARGEPSESRQAFEAATSVYPMSAETAWRYGSFLLRQGDTASGLAEIRHALETDPSLETVAIAQCWSAHADATAIVEHALPQTTGAYLAALDYFVSQKQISPSLIVWARLAELRGRFPMARVIPLVDELISENRDDDAKNVWDQALEATRWPRDSAARDSLIFDGGFENAVLNGGFDWHEWPAVGVEFDMDNAVVHSGKRALRITFNGDANINFQHLFQYVSVRPRKAYRFEGYLRTENITTDSGIGVEILDPRHPAELQILTPSLIGTNAWTAVETDVETGADTNLIEVILRRLPSEKFGNNLKGTVWVDDVSLTPVTEKFAWRKN